jgi:Ion channel
VTLTTLGYGDYIPASNYTRVAASLEAILGYVLLGLFIAAIFRSVERKDDSENVNSIVLKLLEVAKKNDANQTRESKKGANANRNNE